MLESEKLWKEKRCKELAKAIISQLEGVNTKYSDVYTYAKELEKISKELKEG